VGVWRDRTHSEWLAQFKKELLKVLKIN